MVDRIFQSFKAPSEMFQNQYVPIKDIELVEDLQQANQPGLLKQNFEHQTYPRLLKKLEEQYKNLLDILEENQTESENYNIKKQDLLKREKNTKIKIKDLEKKRIIHLDTPKDSKTDQSLFPLTGIIAYKKRKSVIMRSRQELIEPNNESVDKK